jgi:hypothetical protein
VAHFKRFFKTKDRLLLLRQLLNIWLLPVAVAVAVVMGIFLMVAEVLEDIERQRDLQFLLVFQSQ